MTKEDLKKEKRAIYMKGYNKAYGKTRYQSNKEERKAKQRAYNQKNRDTINAKQRAKYQKNKEEAQARGIATYESNKLPYNIVYCIPDYNGKGNNYAGITDNPTNRMAQHKYKGVLNTSEWYELGKVVDRKEAEALEDAFHKLGYHGARGCNNKVA